MGPPSGSSARQRSKRRHQPLPNRVRVLGICLVDRLQIQSEQVPVGQRYQIGSEERKIKTTAGVITKLSTDAAAPASTQAQRTWRSFSVEQAQVAVLTHWFCLGSCAALFL